MRRDILKECHIYRTLKKGAGKRHLSFHTPGHKKGKWDITELSFSDNLSSPSGCILRAEEDIARILGGDKSFILTDGSTCGVLSMLHAARLLGVKTVALPLCAHKSVFNACALAGITPLPFAIEEVEGIPTSPNLAALKENFAGLERADALLLTSPDYYGNIPDLAAFSAYCKERGKLLFIDGAHGGHLHGSDKHAGNYADIWVDGVHKSLPALTQGAVVSAKGERAVAALKKGVDIFRTTSPSYPIMASVEYAVKYPANPALEKKVREFANLCDRALLKEDWTKLCIRFGENAFPAHEAMEKLGIYPEFCDGNVVEFYLSPATSARAWRRLTRTLKTLLQKYPYIPKKSTQRNPAPLVCIQNARTEWVELDSSIGKICANSCGLFPPCTPLIFAGEIITEEKVALLKKAVNVYGLTENKILAVKDEQR